jgi:hypothetical protein
MTKNAWRYFSATVVCGVLAGCGGGNDEPPPYRPMTVNLAVTTGAQAKEITQGAALSIDIDGTLQRIDIGPAPVYINVRDASGTFAATTVGGPSGNIFKVTVPIAANLAANSYAGTLVMRACLDADCNRVYVGTTASVAYTLKVKPPG